MPCPPFSGGGIRLEIQPVHNIFHNDTFRALWLNQIRRKKGLPERPAVDTAAIKEESYRKLGEYVETYLDMDYIIDLIEGRESER